MTDFNTLNSRCWINRYEPLFCLSLNRRNTPTLQLWSFSTWSEAGSILAFPVMVYSVSQTKPFSYTVWKHHWSATKQHYCFIPPPPKSNPSPPPILTFSHQSYRLQSSNETLSSPTSLANPEVLLVLGAVKHYYLNRRTRTHKNFPLPSPHQ